MLDNAWTKFTKRIAINAGIKTLYGAWTNAQGLEHWFLRNAVFKKADGTARPVDSTVEPGDTYTWFWHGSESSETATGLELNGIDTGVVIDLNGVDHFRFRFAGECIVTVKFREDRGLTVVELTQENIPHEEDPEKNLFVACSQGWTFHLTNLKSVYEGGLDLRNKDVSRKGMFNC